MLAVLLKHNGLVSITRDYVAQRSAFVLLLLSLLCYCWTLFVFLVLHAVHSGPARSGRHHACVENGAQAPKSAYAKVCFVSLLSLFCVFVSCSCLLHCFKSRVCVCRYQEARSAIDTKQQKKTDAKSAEAKGDQKESKEQKQQQADSKESEGETAEETAADRVKIYETLCAEVVRRCEFLMSIVPVPRHSHDLWTATGMVLVSLLCYSIIWKIPCPCTADYCVYRR